MNAPSSPRRSMDSEPSSSTRSAERKPFLKTIAAHEEREATRNNTSDDKVAVPALLDREGTSRAKILSNSIKQKRAEKAGKWSGAHPVQARRCASSPGMMEVGGLFFDSEMFRVQASGKRKKKALEARRDEDHVRRPELPRKPPKYERFIRPSSWRMKKAHVTHPELKATFCLDILGS